MNAGGVIHVEKEARLDVAPEIVMHVPLPRAGFLER
jgi:hypothetical protein